MRFIGIVPERDGVFPKVNALRFVELTGILHGLKDARAAAIASLEAVEMDPTDKRPVDTYSKGMRQRVKIAQALVNGASIVVADEPLNGLDPRQRRRLIEVFSELGAQGRCVIISSHVLDEVERFGSRVLVMAQGRLAAEGDFHGIRDLMDDRPHRIRVRCDRPRELAAALVSSGTVLGAQLAGDDRIEIQTVDLVGFGRVVAPIAREVQSLLSEVVPLDDDLESVFRYLVGAPDAGVGR
jgi:ABC-2 type transport system ATP-binding protein